MRRMMKIYWRDSTIPEMQGLSKRECKRIWSAVNWKVFRHYQLWISVLAAGSFSGAVIFLVRFFTDSGRMAESVAAGVSSCFGAFMVMQVFIRMARPYIKEERDRAALVAGKEREEVRHEATDS